MHKTLPYLALFAVVVLLQVFLFDNLSISIYLNPLVYVAFIALLPLDTPPVVLLLSGLATGVTMDLAMGAAGVNTIATLLIAFARPTLLGLLYSRDDIREGGIPSTGRLGNRVFFGGGMIPTFILINQLHMVNTIWAILIPGAFNVWNMILARTYYQSIPKELREASAIDGATEIQHFFKVMLPVCKPIIAVLALWSFVGMWNSYFDAMIYLNDANLQPLQLVLRSILVQNTPQPGMIADIQSTAEMAKVAEQLKYATIVVSSLPLLVMYPFFQKYFDKGIMVGSVKG